jgi:hypothetical protein
MEKFQQGVLEIALVIVKVSRRDMVISRRLDRKDDLLLSRRGNALGVEYRVRNG